MLMQRSFLLVVFALTLLLVGCGSADPEPSPDNPAWTDLWAEYRIAEVGFLKSLPGGDHQQSLAWNERHRDAHRALVVVGELVAITDEDLLLRVQDLELRRYRFGFAMTGGQWPVGLEYVAQHDLDLATQFIAPERVNGQTRSVCVHQ